MSFARFVRPVLAGRRRYSSFFSKQGGGRYISAAKPPKSVVSSAVSNKGDNAAANQSEDSAKGKSSNNGEERPVEESAAPSLPSTPIRTRQRPLYHPVLNEQECRLFQFFALDRPLVFMTAEQAMQRPAPGSLLDLVNPNTYRESTPLIHVGESDLPADADTETARQIMRSLTINIVGGVHDWENTLKRLGIDVNMEPERVGSRKEMEKEWQEVLMDSTKRKRRRKMKKHKLKKRRRALRQRVKK